MPKMNILFLDQYSGLSGGQKVLLDIISAFSKKGYGCLAALPGEGLLSERLKSLGIETKFIPLGYYSIAHKNPLDIISFGLRLPILIFLLARMIRKENIDAVYANGARTFIWATAACCMTKTPLVWHIHSIFKDPIICYLLNKLVKSPCVKKVFAVSRSAAAPIIKAGGKLEVIYNAAETNQPSKETDCFKNEFALSKDDFLVAAVGILEEWKNQEDLIKAAKYIKDLGKEKIIFLIIGDSLYKNAGKQKYRDKLKTLTRELGLEGSVIFTGFRSDIKEIMHCLDVLVITSKDPDPCPLVGLEAASCGVALVSEDAGGMKEMFQEGKQALFFKAGDFKALAQKLIFLLDNPKDKDSLTQAARELINREHSLDNYLQKLTGKTENAIYGN
jgi:glycosyltransferase involved in cell wall biosynthesis